MRILVTGGAGFIGSHLVDKLIELGHDVSVIDNLSTGRREYVHPEARFYEKDIRNEEGVKQVFSREKPEAVFHFAAQISVRRSEDDPYEDTAINALGGMNVVRTAIEKSVGKFIFASTGGALYGETSILPTSEEHSVLPRSLYGHNKWFLERALEFHRRASDLDYVALRFSNVYGPRQNSSQEGGVISIFINTLLADGTPVIYGDGEQTRDFLYVNDAVDAVLRALDRPMERLTKRPVFNVGTGRETSINALFENISRVLNRKDHKPDYEDARDEEIRRSVLATHKIKEELGFDPQYDLDEGLKRTIAWFSNPRGV